MLRAVEREEEAYEDEGVDNENAVEGSELEVQELVHGSKLPGFFEPFFEGCFGHSV